MRLSLLALALLYSGVASAQTLFRFPGADQHRQFFNITAYRDNSGSGNGLQDWSCGTDTYDGHKGTDMGVGGFAGMDAGRDIVAAADGTVAFVGTQGALGSIIVLNHNQGYQTRYAQLSRSSVARGQQVKRGETIALVGQSGTPSHPESHLHFEVRSNSKLGWVAENPLPLLGEK